MAKTAAGRCQVAGASVWAGLGGGSVVNQHVSQFTSVALGDEGMSATSLPATSVWALHKYALGRSLNAAGPKGLSL